MCLSVCVCVCVCARERARARARERGRERGERHNTSLAARASCRAARWATNASISEGLRFLSFFAGSAGSILLTLAGTAGTPALVDTAGDGAVGSGAGGAAGGGLGGAAGWERKGGGDGGRMLLSRVSGREGGRGAEGGSVSPAPARVLSPPPPPPSPPPSPPPPGLPTSRDGGRGGGCGGRNVVGRTNAPPLLSFLSLLSLLSRASRANVPNIPLSLPRSRSEASESTDTSTSLSLSRCRSLVPTKPPPAATVSGGMAEVRGSEVRGPCVSCSAVENSSCNGIPAT